MSPNTKTKNPFELAKQAERDLNSYEAKTGNKSRVKSIAVESGIDSSVTSKFPGSTAEYGSHVSGAGGNRDIPVEQGGDYQKGTGRLTKAREFDQGQAGEGPEDISRKRRDENPGSDEFDRGVRELSHAARGTPESGGGVGAPMSARGPGRA